MKTSKPIYSIRWMAWLCIFWINHIQSYAITPFISEIQYNFKENNIILSHCMNYHHALDENIPPTPFDVSDDSFITRSFCEGVEISGLTGTDLSCYSLVFYEENPALSSGINLIGTALDVIYLNSQGIVAQTNVAGGNYLQLYGQIDYDNANNQITGLIIGQPSTSDPFGGLPLYANFDLDAIPPLQGMPPPIGEAGLYIDMNFNNFYDVGDMLTAPQNFEWEYATICTKKNVGARWFPIYDIPIGTIAIGLFNSCTGDKLDLWTYGGGTNNFTIANNPAQGIFAGDFANTITDASNNPLTVPNTVFRSLQLSDNNWEINIINNHTIGYYNCNLSSPAVTSVQVKTILEGAYDTTTNLMGTELRNHLSSNSNLLPLTHPYQQQPWNHTLGQYVYTTTDLPTNTVDWVLLEAWTPTTQTLVEQRVGILLEDGQITDVGALVEGNAINAVCFYELTDNTEYYFVVRHRNHLDVVTAMPQTVTSWQINYDFTIATQQAMGKMQLKEVEMGVFAQYAGDYEANGIINYADFNLFDQERNMLNQYNQADGKMDGSVMTSDFDIYQPNAPILGVPFVRY